MDYQEFLETKKIRFESSGVDVDPSLIHPSLFEFQRDLVKWALRKGRSAIFADTGLGKTFMQLEWARLVDKKVLIIAPLSVARQTVREARKIDLQVYYVRHQQECASWPGKIYITNYEMVDKFDLSQFGAVVLDESSILKGLSGKIRKRLTEKCKDVKYKLCCTATPAPNDIAEIANHAEFLSIMSRNDMLAAFFVHDDQGWRLRGHAQTAFFRWMASWGMSIRKPSDLGYDDDGFILPDLNINPVIVETGYAPEDQLFFTGLKGITDRSKVRRSTINDRVNTLAEIVNNSDDQWIVWCGLNDESSAANIAIPDAIEVKGSDSLESKIQSLEDFQDGIVRVLVTKTKIAGFGMNFQNCHNMGFLGLNDSWESYYQAVRRCYRFGQQHPVNVSIILADVEQEILYNIRQKEAQANEMAAQLIDNVQQYEREGLMGLEFDKYEYEQDTVVGDGWKLMLGDSVERLAEVADESVDLSVFSPPFATLYTYSPTERDLGNSKDYGEFFSHFKYIIEHLMRVTRPGRNCAVHVQQLATTLNHHGVIGMYDLRGDVIRAFVEAGWIFHGEVTIDKNPQAQAIRTHSKSLLFVQLEKDSTWSRPAFGDFIVLFRKPGDNQTPVKPVQNGELSRDQWIEWAHPIWYGIQETDTLNYIKAREDKDERHICPLQLGTIERCITLWSNPGETILSPFAGIGSEIYQALKMGRKGIGIELKRSYFNVAVNNLRHVKDQQTMDLFAYAARSNGVDDATR